MSSPRELTRKLATVSRLRHEKEYDKALTAVEDLLRTWPGNGHLHILWASLVQLQDNPKHSLAEAKQALQRAVELDKDSPAGALELAYFLDNVEDNPRAAAKVFSDGVVTARQKLIDGLIGQTKALLQLDQKEDALVCLIEVLHLTHFEPGAKRTRSAQSAADFIFDSPMGHVYKIRLNGPFADRIEEILDDLSASRSAVGAEKAPAQAGNSLEE